MAPQGDESVRDDVGVEEWTLTTEQDAFLAELRRLVAEESWAAELMAPPDGDFAGQRTCLHRGAPMLAWLDKTVGDAVVLTVGVFVGPGVVYAAEVHNQLFEWREESRVPSLTETGSSEETAAAVHRWLAALLGPYPAER